MTNLTKKVVELTQHLVEKKSENLKAASIEEIQDIVEYILLSSDYKKTAKSYLLYREQQAKLRDFTQNANTNMVDEYLQKLDWEVNENSNMTYSIQGLNNYMSSHISKSYWLNKIYSKEIREAHQNGDFHIHDLNMISVYCVGWDLKDLLLQGFTGIRGKVQCTPPKHFRTALGQAVNFLYTMQGEATGAQAFSNFDTLLAPFIRYDELDYKQVKQAMQEFIFNLNVPTRTGFQTPFTNITMDLTVPSYYANQNVIIGGEAMAETYSEFQDEMNMLNKAYFEVMMKGDATGQVFTFPIPTYNITKDFDWENPELNGLWEAVQFKEGESDIYTFEVAVEEDKPDKKDEEKEIADLKNQVNDLEEKINTFKKQESSKDIIVNLKTKVEDLTGELATFKEKASDKDGIQKELDYLKNKIRDNEFENFVEKQLEKGVLIPANKDVVLKIFKELDNVKKFDSTSNAVEDFKTFVASLPKQIEFEEVATKKKATTPTADHDEFADASEESLEIFNEATALAQKENIDFKDALLKLNKGV